MSSSTALPSQHSRSRRKTTNSTLRIPELFLHTCRFVSSVSDMLSFREAVGECGLVLPKAKGPSGGAAAGNTSQKPSNKSTEHSAESSEQSPDDVDKVSQFQEVAQNLVLSQWPSLKPLQKSMENKSRWLNIGRVLELRDESNTPPQWQRHLEWVRERLDPYKDSLETEFCREHFDMLRDTVTFVDVETREDSSLFGYKTIMMAKFVHPVHGNWISYEASLFAEVMKVNQFWFEFPIRPDSKQTTQCEYGTGESPCDDESVRRMWDYLTKATPPKFPPHKITGFCSPKEEQEKCQELEYFLMPLESAFGDTPYDLGFTAG